MELGMGSVSTEMAVMLMDWWREENMGCSRNSRQPHNLALNRGIGVQLRQLVGEGVVRA